MDSVRMILLLLVCCLRSSLCDESSERFTFDLSVSCMTTYITTEEVVTHIEMDQYVDGNLLFSDGSSLKTTDGKITRTVAGQSSEKGYKEGVGESARFNGITGFHQLTSSKVVVADSTNDCLRQVDRISGQTEVFSGSCTEAGYADGAQALFNRPWSVILDNMNQDKLLVTDTDNEAVRHVDIYNGVVSTFFEFNSPPDNPIGITQDISCGDLYMTTVTALYQLNYQTKELRLIAGSPTQLGFRDGDFSLTKFNVPFDLIRIDKGRKLIVAGRNNHRLRVVDRETNTSYSICTGSDGHINGDMNSCSLTRPYSLMVSGDSLYIGEDQRIRRMSGYYACDIITKILPPGEKFIEVITSPGHSLQLPAGEYHHKMTGNAYNCTVHISINEGQVDKISACQNITKILHPGEKSIEVIISPEHSLQLPAGEYLHEMTGNAYNCTVHISINEGQVDKISACQNITKILHPGEKSIEVITSPGHSLQLPAGEYHHKMTGNAYNCAVHISINEGQVDKISACQNITKILHPGEKSIEVIISPEHSLQLSAGEYLHKMTGHAYNCTVHISITEGHDACGNITRILQPGEKFVEVIMTPGQSLQLPAGEYRHKLTTILYNCTVHISITEGQANSTGACGNITKILHPGEKFIEVIISPEQSLELPAGEYRHKMTGNAYNCIVHISITEGENVDRDEEEETTTTGTIDMVVAVFVVTVMWMRSRYLFGGGGALEQVEMEDGGVEPLEPVEREDGGVQPLEPVEREDGVVEPLEPVEMEDGGVGPLEPVEREDGGVEPLEPVEREDGGVEPLEPEEREDGGVEPLEPVEREDGGVEPLELVEMEDGGVGPLEPVEREDGGVEPLEPVEREDGGVEPLEPVEREDGGFGPLEPVEREDGGVAPLEPVERKDGEVEPLELVEMEDGGVGPLEPVEREGVGVIPIRSTSNTHPSEDVNDLGSSDSNTFNNRVDNEKLKINVDRKEAKNEPTQTNLSSANTTINKPETSGLNIDIPEEQKKINYDTDKVSMGSGTRGNME